MINKLAEIIVQNRNRVLAVMLAICAICAFLTLRVPINTDMTKYLPDDSEMKQGIDLMAEEFSGMSMSNTIRVLFRGLTEEEKGTILEELSGLTYADSVSLTAEDEENTLYTISTSYGYFSTEEQALENAVKETYADRDMELVNDATNSAQIPTAILITAMIILMVVLFALSASWAEPLLFLFTIGTAIVINMGTNLILGSVSQITFSISAVLQLVLSMDYSIILMNRYRQEKAVSGAGPAAMQTAFSAAFPSVISSGMTTLIGMFMLVFMRFKIGMDLGLVLAKGVLMSMICVLTILPGLILIFDGLIEKTHKRVLAVPTGLLTKFSYGARRVMPVIFIALFAISAWTQRGAGITYSLSMEDPIAEVFTPQNAVVVLYDNSDEDKMSGICTRLEAMDSVDSVSAYATTLGKRMTADELSGFIKEMSGQEMVSGTVLQMLYVYYGTQAGEDWDGKLSIEELFAFLTEHLTEGSLLTGILGEDMISQIDSFSGQLADGKAQLVGKSHSIMMISTTFPVEGETTTAFLEELKGMLDENLTGKYYLIGNSVMSYEMKGTFRSELTTITMLTAAAIFLVVALTFRSLTVPLILVLLVQCGVYITITTVDLIGYDMYYLAVLIVQCILMGATVDYGILYTNYYRERREHMGIRESILEAYKGSIHTILTSSLFVVSATGAIGLSPADPTIAQICKTIALGTASATLLILLVLPGLLAGFDKVVLKRINIANPDRLE